jgi:integrase
MLDKPTPRPTRGQIMGKLTDTKIRKALRAGSDTTLTDGGARGHGALVLRIRSTGAASWYVKRWQNGRPFMALIGPLAAIGLAEARRRYTDLIGSAKPGESLRATASRAAIERRELATLAELLAGYVAHLEGRRSAVEARRLLLDGPDAAARHLRAEDPANSLRPEEVAAWLARWPARGSTATGNKARTFLSAAYGWGLRHDLHPARIMSGSASRFKLDTNPAAIVPPPGPRGAGERFLDLDELRALLAWCRYGSNRADPRALVALQIIAMSGQRPEAVLALTVDHLDRRPGWITWKAEEMKARRAHSIPRTGPVADLVAQALELPRIGRHLFPGWKDPGAPYPAASLRWLVRRFCTSTGAARFSTRDLRRSWRVHALQAGMSAEAAAAIMAHAWGPQVASRHYSSDTALDRLKLEGATVMADYWQRHEIILGGEARKTLRLVADRDFLL